MASERQQITVASVAIGVGLLLLGITPRVAPLERIDAKLVGWLIERTGADAADMVGTGDFDDPRRVRAAPVRVPAGDLPPPRFLAITNDPERWFQSSPPGPVDLAIVFERLHSLGHRQVTSAALLAWETPDPFAAGALDHELGRFRPAVVGAPLVRGLGSDEMPPAFRRLSVPLKEVLGETAALPIVNRVAVPGIRFGKTNTLAAFTLLENEAPPPFAGSSSAVPVPLLARWGDRAVVALPLAHLMARFGVSADKLEIALGKEIRLGDSGPIIPIDEQGQTLVIPGTADHEIVIPAEELTRREEEGVPQNVEPGEVPLVIRDDRSDAPAAVRAYSAHLGEILVALDRVPRAGPPTVIKRPHPVVELLIVGILAGLAGGALRLQGRLRHIAFAAGVLVTLLMIYLLVARFEACPPTLALLGVPLAGWTATLFIPERKTGTAAPKPARPKPAPKPRPKPETEAAPKPAPRQPSKPAAKRPARKKPKGRRSRRKRR
jgi:hypothetical protein